MQTKWFIWFLCLIFAVGPMKALETSGSQCEDENVEYEENVMKYYPEDKESMLYTIPEGTKKVSVNIFYNTYLRYLIIPASCDEISFCGIIDSRLQGVIVHPDNEVYATQDGVVYSKDLSTLIFCPPAKEATLFVVPESTQFLYAGCLENVSEINYIVIPDSVKEIGGFAFEESSIMEIVICGMDTELSAETFNYCPVLKEIWLHPNSKAEKILMEDTEYIDLRDKIRYW